MTLEESANLINDATFRGRVKVAALKYAQFLVQSAQPNSKFQWAQRTMQMPEQAAQTLVAPVVLNPNVQGAGANVQDNDLQAAVQMVADMMI